MGAFAVKNWGGNPIELQLLIIPECELTGRRAINATLQEPRSKGERTILGNNKDRQILGQSVFKRSARQSAWFGSPLKRFPSLAFDRASLGIAWKYVYLFPAGYRLTRYVE